MTDVPAPDLAALFEPCVWSWFQGRFGSPTPPQVASWPRIASGRHTLIFSPTGSGKTLAAFLWCLNELYRLGREDRLEDAVYVLYISPLKALNNDIQRNLTEPLEGIAAAAAAAGLDLPEVRSEVRTGDTSAARRAAMAGRPPHILITTPESLFIILSTQRFRLALRTVQFVIVDEIHAVCDNKRGVHLSLSLERLRALAGDGFVRVGLSATQKPLDRIAAFLTGVDEAGQPRPCEIVDIGARRNLDVQVITPVDNLLEAHFDAIWASTYDRLLALVRQHRTTLVFTNSRYKTERTAMRLNELAEAGDLRVGAHHGSMARAVRLDMEERLKRGQLDGLVATSSLELGIDVGAVDLVCQLESPRSVSRGLQRIGRAGHLLGATSKGRLLVVDRDDLVEAAALVRAILDGDIDSTRIPSGCLDVLAQHVVGAVAADEWRGADLYRLCRGSWCYRDLARDAFDRVLEMLSGGYRFDAERDPYARINWDQVNDRLVPERGARVIAFRSSGTIPDEADYDVYLPDRGVRVGSLDEDFVEDLRHGDIFVLGSSSWRVTGFQRRRVLVEDVYGRAPTVPYWHGNQRTRTADLGRLVGRFRREMAAHLQAGDAPGWLRREHALDENGVRALCEYFRQQVLLAGVVPSDQLLVIEHFRDQLGGEQVVLHSSLGGRLNRTWALALCHVLEQRYRARFQRAVVDDGILLTIPRELQLSGAQLAAELPGLLPVEGLEALVREAVLESPALATRFRHNAVRSLQVLREYQGRRTPVWIQSARAADLLQACRGRADYPVLAETVRECTEDDLDVPGLRQVLEQLEAGDLAVQVLASEVPSPFSHTLLLLGQYYEQGANATRERRSRLMHLHRQLLRQVLDEESLAGLLDAGAAEFVEAKLQFTHPHRRARTAAELARALAELGDLVEAAGDELSIGDRVDPRAGDLLAGLARQGRAVEVPLPSLESHPRRWIAAESFALYRDAFRAEAAADLEDGRVLAALEKAGPVTAEELQARLPEPRARRRDAEPGARSRAEAGL
ncbi:MAG: ATP-dependent helicase, partial [Gemmatimonadota bacterium]